MFMARIATTGGFSKLVGYFFDFIRIERARPIGHSTLAERIERAERVRIRHQQLIAGFIRDRRYRPEVVAVQVFDGLVDNRNRRTTIKRPDVQDAVANAALLHRFMAGVLGIGDPLFEVPDIEGVLDPLVTAVLPGRLLVIALPVRAVLEFVSRGGRGRFRSGADGDSRRQVSGIPVDELVVAAVT
jgi:hypothetical protein